MIRRAPTQKARAAVGFFLNDAAARRNGGRAERIGWPKDCDYRETYCGSDVHRAGVVPNEQMALRKKRG